MTAETAAALHRTSDPNVDVGVALSALGGSAPFARLRELGCSWDAVQLAVARGGVERLARGRYALTGLADARAVAVQLAGVASHLSAAQLWGMALARVPQQPHVTVARNRGRVRVTDAVLHWSDIPQEHIGDHVTSPLRTVVDCARMLPFDEALRRPPAAACAAAGREATTCSMPVGTGPVSSDPIGVAAVVGKVSVELLAGGTLGDGVNQ